MIAAALRAIASVLSMFRRAWLRVIAIGLPAHPVAVLDVRHPGRSPELEELFRAATHLRAENGLIPMSALRSLSPEDRAAVQRLSQAEARRMIQAWLDASLKGSRNTTATEATEPYRRPR